MSNRALLLNTAFLTSDPYLLDQKLSEPGMDFVEVAEAAYKIPVPWLLCFRPEDIRPVSVPLEDERTLEVGLPCAPVKQALGKMEQSLPIFEAIAGNSKLAKMFWQNAMSYLQALPLPYLTLNPIEVMFMADPAPYAQLMRTAMSGGGSAATDALIDLSCYEKGVQPFPPDVLYAIAGGDRDDPRTGNCVALDIGYGSFWHEAADSEGDHPDLPLPMSSPAAAPNLRILSDHVEALAKAVVKSAGITLSFAPKTATQGEPLKMLLSAETDAECATLLNDKAFRTKLDGPIHTALNSMCQDYGFTWAGYVVRSNESVKRRFTGDYRIYNDWISMPVVK